MNRASLSKRGLLLWGTILVGGGVGMVAYGQVSLFRAAPTCPDVSARRPVDGGAGGSEGAASGRGDGRLSVRQGAGVPVDTGGATESKVGNVHLQREVRSGVVAGEKDGKALSPHPVSRKYGKRRVAHYRSTMPSRMVRLTRGLKRWLRRRAKRRLPEGWLYVITGYATERSTVARNKRLATARAEAVRRYLVHRLSVSPDRVRVYRSVRKQGKPGGSTRRGVKVCVGPMKECR